MDRQSLNLELYRKVYLIRAAENAIRKHYHEDQMKTPMHMSMGEEAVVVGICEALGARAQVYGTYRSHALYIAKTGETDAFFGEMYGKETGTARGKAGSMHLASPEHGLMCSAAIVSSTIPVAVGTAFANKRLGTGRPTAAFFGDGATDAGVFWESLNAACLMGLPLMFVCQDNGLAMHTRRVHRQGFRSLPDVVRQFNCSVHVSDSTDVEEIHDLAARALEEMKTTGRPALMHCSWFRYLEHVGVNEDFDAGYRSRTEALEWLARDPVALQRQKLTEKLGIPEARVAGLEQELDAGVARGLQAAMDAPFSPVEEAFTGLFG